MMNKCMFIGRLTRDPELRTYSGDKTLVKFSLAVQRFSKDDDVDFFDFTAFGKRAEVIEKYVGKGNRIFVQASARLEKWQDKDGNNRQTIGFIVDDFTFIDFKDSDNRNEDQYQEESRPANTSRARKGDLPF